MPRFAPLSCSRVLLAGLLALAMSGPVRAAQCRWKPVISPDHVRFPVQMDLHATYAIYLFENDGSVALKVAGRFPYAAFLSFTTYEATRGLLTGALLDRDIEPDPGSQNPFRDGNLVNAPQRSYAITVLPASHSPAPNSLSMPPIPEGATSVPVALVMRVYLAEPGRDRLGDVPLPTITPVAAAGLATELACSPAPSDDPARTFGTFDGKLSPPPRHGRILFYRPPVSSVPFADGSGPLAPGDCTGYLMATLEPDKIAIIHLPRLPAFFNNANTDAVTTFRTTQVRYLSLGSYGASLVPPLGTSLAGNLAGTEIAATLDGQVTFVIVPDLLAAATKTQVAAKAAARGWNLLPMARAGRLVAPFLIYRNKVAQDHFLGDIANVPCYPRNSFDRAPGSYAASVRNMGLYAPAGFECAASDFLLDRCGR